MAKPMLEVENEETLTLFKAYSSLCGVKLKVLSGQALQYYMENNPIKNKSLILSDFVRSIKKNKGTN